MKKYRHLIIFLFSAFIFLFMFFFITDFVLKKHTNHNQLIEVPDLLDKTFQEVHNVISGLGLNYVVIGDKKRDYNPKFKTNSVTSQNPLPYTNVKAGRSIYITINADKIPKTTFPKIIDQPYRYAKNILESNNLKVGDIFYKSDIAQNVIVEANYNNFKIRKLDSVPIFSSIDLYIGTGLPKNQFEYKVPNLKGYNLNDAINILKNNFLNYGAIYTDESLKDSLSLFVFKQNIPPRDKPKKLYFSQFSKAPTIDLWLTSDSTKLIEQ